MEDIFTILIYLVIIISFFSSFFKKKKSPKPPAQNRRTTEYEDEYVSQAEQPKTNQGNGNILREIENLFKEDYQQQKPQPPLIGKEPSALSRQTTLEQRASDEHLKTPSEHKMETGWERQRKQLQEQKKQISDTVAAQAAKFEELLLRQQQPGSERLAVKRIREKLMDSESLIQYMIIGEILDKPKSRRRFI